LPTIKRATASVWSGSRRNSKKFDPEDAYEDDSYQIRKAQVAKHVSLLVGSFPNAAPGNPEVYVMMLVEEIIADAPSVPVLESTRRIIRRTQKFLPAISEVLEILKEEKKWDKCLDGFQCDDVAEALREKLDAEKQRREAEAKEREERNRIAALPFKTGDAVHHSKFGDGTVQEIDGNKCTVKFDSSDEPKKVVAEFIQHRVVIDGGQI